MKKLLGFILLFISTTFCVQAQFGLSLRYNQNNFEDFNRFVDSRFEGNGNSILSTGYEIGIDYWFRLKNARIEFYPELFYGISSSKLSMFVEGDHSQDMKSLGFNANIQIYPFDILGDCDCPTFSKEGNVFTKGFFLQFSPGISLIKFSQWTPILSAPQETEHFSYKIAIGGGFDIGINNLLTITPHVRYGFYNRAEWNNFALAFPLSPDDTINDSKMRKWQFGIRIGFRPDYRN